MKLAITTKDSVLIEELDLDEYDLSKPLARASLLHDIEDAIEDGKKIEREMEEEDG